jgi:hypothetical protein
MESILLKLEDLIEEIEAGDLNTKELLIELKKIKEEVEEKVINDSFGTLEWGDLD